MQSHAGFGHVNLRKTRMLRSPLIAPTQWLTALRKNPTEAGSSTLACIFVHNRLSVSLRVPPVAFRCDLYRFNKCSCRGVIDE